jgi:hypothetical protein
MTDLEIRRACAEMMETPPNVPGASSIWAVTITWANGKNVVSHWVRGDYDPLTNDAQAMALAKRLRINQNWLGFPAEWRASRPAGGCPPIECQNADLNRAICECAAKMRAEK